jgi:PIN domain
LITYLDTSVFLAQLFAEDRCPPPALWKQRLVASRLLDYEVFNRVNARRALASHGADARSLVDRIQLVEMSSRVLARALMPFPQPARTLDSLHLATLDFLRSAGLELQLATYDQRLAANAVAMGFMLADC